jgi:sulfur carrier protein
MKITVNGSEKLCADKALVSDLLVQLDLVGRRVAVERNGEIVPRSLHASVALADGDQIEIVVAVGGG